MIVITFILMMVVKCSKQDCNEEVSINGISVTWPSTATGGDIESEPICYASDGTLITRTCNNTTWSPALAELAPCMKVVKYFDLNSCPPGYYKISDNNTEYCYQISPASKWDYPCFQSGGATVITDLNKSELDSLIEALNVHENSRYYWLPGQRSKYYNPLVWMIPGPNWGRLVESNNDVPIQQSLIRNCLLLDIQNRKIVTEVCDRVYPSLCFYLNNHYYPAICPEGYHSFRFMPDKGVCFGIEFADNIFGSNFNDFLHNKCQKPMADNRDNTVSRFIFKKMAEDANLSDHDWCWFESSYFHNGSHINPRDNENNNDDIITEVMLASLEGIINNQGTLGLMNTRSTLKCMACEAAIIYDNTELIFEYNTVDATMYLTIYFPSGLWKYEQSHKGVQCFSNARGFVSVINIDDMPYFKIEDTNEINNNSSVHVDKIVYIINPVTDRSAQYWCEAHTKNFTLLKTRKIVVNPKGNNQHVFSLVIKTDTLGNSIEESPDFTDLVNIISDVFNSQKTLIMDILDINHPYITILFHLHIDLKDETEEESLNLQNTYEKLHNIAMTELQKYYIIFVNISSSTHCLPIKSTDIFILEWEKTPIGQIAAPKQFCLQNNGLPVTRKCMGSYLIGSIWGSIDGICSENYEASKTTTFLYNLAKGQTSLNNTARFLTDGLSYVLSDVDIIIPADIYYLSMSFQYVLGIAQDNTSSIEIGDIQNIAWAMNRVMVLDEQYLRLAQTLNSTNVIVDSINDIIELIAQQNLSSLLHSGQNNFSSITSYQLAVESKFISQISYPVFNNISGIALLRNTESNNFTDMTILPLYRNTSINDILNMDNVEVATWIPDDVLLSLKVNKKENNTNDNFSEVNFNEVHIVISIYYNDAVFQEIECNEYAINSRIIGISVPGYVSNLEHPVTLVFRQLNNSFVSNTCSYWNFHTPSLYNVPGYWANEGCYFVTAINGLTICKCYHLTNFGQLLSTDWVRDKNIPSLERKHTKALNIITLIGCFLSLSGITGIWITAIVFHSWRKKPGTKVLLQLSAAISLPLILILVFNLDNTIFLVDDDKYEVAEHMIGVCIALGALLHYSILSGFVWMLITAILQFIRYVRVLGVRRPSRFMIKFTLIGWGIPLLPVLSVLIMNKHNYVPVPSYHDAYNGPICYPNGNYFIFAVVIPITVILIVNIVLFASVIYSISRGPNGKMREVDLDMIGAQLRLSILLFFLLGLSWFFGILTFSNNILWSYLFCLTATLQGFVLFLYFVICDPATRSLWVTLMKPSFYSSSSRDSIVSVCN